jgi:acetyl esterase/lipase
VIRTEAAFLAQLERLAPETDAVPGYSAAVMRAILQRPAVDPEGSRFVPSVAYSDTAGEIGQMALYARRDPSERAPIVLFAHGGGFQSGNHFNNIRYIHPLAARGCVGATMTYRFRDEAPWPAPLEDAKCAVRWLRRHADEIGGDPDRIIFAGDSAGAYVAIMTALTPGSHEGDGGWHDVSSELQGAILLYPPVDLRSTSACGQAQEPGEVLADYIGDEIDAYAPINNVHGDCPPVLTMTGTADVLVPERDVRRFHAALDAVGVRNRLEVFEGAAHCFDWHPAAYERVLPMILDFVDETVGLPVHSAGAPPR